MRRIVLPWYAGRCTPLVYMPPYTTLVGYTLLYMGRMYHHEA